MDSHKLKIYQGNGRDYAPVPEIRLKGKWLESLGFSIGDIIQADCENEQITIRKPDKNTEEAGNKNGRR